MSKTLIVIPVHNALPLTLACLASLEADRVPGGDILVVDNGSTDGTVPAVQARFPQIGIISQANRGFAAAVNVGLRQSLEQGYQYTWVLNNDTVISPGTPGALAALMERPDNAQVGACSPLILLANPPNQVDCAGGWLRVSNWDSGHLTNPAEGQQFLVAHPEASFISGCAMFIRNEAVRAIGLWDERFFMYWEDADFCVRLVRAGWRLRMLAAASIIHRRGGSGGERGAFPVYYHTRNRFLIWRKHTSRRERMATLMHIWETLVPIVPNPWIRTCDEGLLGFVKALGDGMLGLYGRRRPLATILEARILLCVLFPFVTAFKWYLSTRPAQDDSIARGVMD